MGTSAAGKVTSSGVCCYAAFPLGLTFGRSMDSSALIFVSAASMTHICGRGSNGHEHIKIANICTKGLGDGAWRRRAVPAVKAFSQHARRFRLS